jgi:hypothetical protein
MRISLALLTSQLVLPLVLSLVAACGGSSTVDADPFDTLQACYDEHHTMESLPVQQAIVVCCLDHPIAGIHPSCQNTPADCVSHVRTNLDASVLDADITAACTTYISQK